MNWVVAVVLLCLGAPSFADDSNGGVSLMDPITQESTLMGQKLKIEQAGETVPSGQGVAITTSSEFLGHSGNLIEASVEAIPSASASPTPAAGAAATTNTSGLATYNQALQNGSAGISTTTLASGTTTGTAASTAVVLGTTDLYISGVRLWTGALQYQNGTLSYTGGVSPTQIPFTIFVYPVGPMTLQVDAGVEFEGNLTASIAVGPSYPLSDSTLDAKLAADVGAGGFIEGYANLWLLRGGVGGAVNLVEGETGLGAHILLNGQKPVGTQFGMIHLLSGDVYGFVDTKFFFGKWNRVYKKDFYKWNGWCYSFGSDSCGIQ